MISSSRMYKSKSEEFQTCLHILRGKNKSVENKEPQGYIKKTKANYNQTGQPRRERGRQDSVFRRPPSVSPAADGTLAPP